MVLWVGATTERVAAMFYLGEKTCYRTFGG
jgi:hypothetical protein